MFNSWGLYKIKNTIIFLCVFTLQNKIFVSRADSSETLIKKLIPNLLVTRDLMGQADPKAFERFADSVSLAKTLILQNPDCFEFQNSVGVILAKVLDDGIGGEGALSRLRSLREEFDADGDRRVRQGIATIILNILYKSEKWLEGFDIIKEEAEKGIVNPEFIDNIEGFCSGAATSGKANEARDTYAHVAKNAAKISDGIHTAGDCLLRLSHFDALCHDSVSRLAVLKSIETNHADYYKKNEPIICYFKFAAYSDLGMQIEAAASLIGAARTANLLATNQQKSGISPSIIKSIAKSLPAQIASYKKAGWIDEKFELKVENSQNGNKVVTKRPTRSLTSMIVLVSTVVSSALAFYYIYVNFLTKQRL